VNRVRGNFPLSDDWAFRARRAKLAETGTLDSAPWTGASVVFQAAYGALLTAVFGFSFTVLRCLDARAGVQRRRRRYLFLRDAACAVRLLALAAWSCSRSSPST
jgi:hypothetical protein